MPSVRVGDNLKVYAARVTGALATANARLRSDGEFYADVRTAYSAGGAGREH